MDKYRFYLEVQKIGLERIKERETGNDAHISGLYNFTDGYNVILFPKWRKTEMPVWGGKPRILFWSYRRRYPRRMKRSYPGDC